MSKILNDQLSWVNLVGWSLLVVIGLVIQGCAARYAVIASTGTSIGVDIAQSPANQTPHMKLGYNRGEVAIVPTNRSGGEEPGSQGGGAKDVADVLMELRYSGIFSTNAGIYQRLAVGPTAVTQPGASLMFAKDPSGQISDKASDVLKSLKAIPAPSPDISKAKVPLRLVFVNSGADQQKFHEVAKTFGFHDFNGVLTNQPREPTLDEIQKIRESLEAQGFKFKP